METRIRRMLLKTCVGIVLILCCMSGVACDVPDDVVYTDPHKNVRIGDSVVLKCQLRGTPLAVYWKKGNDPNRAPTLISWTQGDDVTGKCIGERPCRIMEMNEDHSLVIKEVSIAEQGRYICRAESYKGILIHNFTDINVFSPPKKPYPFINECLWSPDMKSNQTCMILTTEDPINISCTASGYFPDLDLSFIRGSLYITTLYSEVTTNEDGKKNKSIISQASSSPEPYVCVASDIPGVEGQSVASVLVTSATASVDRSDSALAVKIVVPLIFIVLLIAVILGAIILWHIRQEEPVSYVELWILVDEGDLANVKDIVIKLVGNSEGNTSKEDLYRILCEWKEGSPRDVRSLYRAIKQLGLHDDLKRIKDFRACTSVPVSDDDLAHICWHVRSCEEETVNPILRALYSPDSQGRRPTFSTSNSFEDDFRMMKRWKSGSIPEKVTFRSGSEEISVQVGSTLSTPGNNDEDDEVTPMNPVSGKVHLKVKKSPPNQTIRLCIALEEAGKTVAESHRPVYLQLAKTFFQIRDKHKSALTAVVLKEFALSLTKRHCQRLGNTLGLSEIVIAARNEEDLGVIFRTDAMLRDWVKDQKCSNYEMRRRLRQTAQNCNRHDIADMFIPEDQSNIMPLTGQDYLTRTDDNQCPRNSVSDGACVLPLNVSDNISDEGFIEIAYRLVTAEVRPLAEDLGISEQLLTSYKPMRIEPKQLDQGTIKMLREVKTNETSEMLEVLKTAGYSDEEAAIYFDPVSYVELWKLVDEGDLAKVKDIVSKLVGNSEGNTAKEDFYRILCEWKDGSSGNVRSLYRAINQLGFHDDLQRIKDFRACTSVSVSDDDLAHICWHVRSFKVETVNPILLALYSSDREGSRPIFSKSKGFEDDLQLMKRWRSVGSKDISQQVGSTLSTPGNSDEVNEMTPMDPVSEEVHLKVNKSPPNQKIRLCPALEEAWKTVEERHRPVYIQLAKTLFQIRDEYKSELTFEVLKGFALSLTKRHCQRLGETLGLPVKYIDTRNEADLGLIFRTDAMLWDWVKDQKCSYYEMRCRLRQTAERCNRNDIADDFIPKEQSIIIPLMTPDYQTRTDDNQRPRNSVSDGNGDISPDELNRIGLYAGSEVLLQFRSKYESREVPKQQTSDMSGREEPLLPTILASLRIVLDKLEDSKLFLMNRKPRDTLRKLLRKRHPSYACLLPVKRNDKIFDVEYIELAFRLVMADVHPFAEDLGISDQLLTSYKPNFERKQLEHGTIMFLKPEKPPKAVKTKDRSEMSKVLTTAGYSEEAKAIYYGFEISLHDVLEVENTVDMAQLANKLGVPEVVQPMRPAKEIGCGERQHSVLFRWKDTVRSSTFNHRLFLCDTIFNMGKEELALDIIAGKYRKRVINTSVSEMLANTMREEQLSTLCGVLDQEDRNCQDVITAWAGEITKKSKLDILGKNVEKRHRKLSNKLLQNGFYHFAYEIMAGAWQGQEDNTAVENQQTVTGSAAT